MLLTTIWLTKSAKKSEIKNFIRVKIAIILCASSMFSLYFQLTFHNKYRDDLFYILGERIPASFETRKTFWQKVRVSLGLGLRLG